MVASKINGLLIIKRFISPLMQNKLIELIDSGTWSPALKRRVQHFGYHYNYKARRISYSPETLPVPAWGEKLVRQIVTVGIPTQALDQLIVNEYLPGQGIAPHIDCVTCFDDEIVSVSLGSSCVMTFSKARQGKEHDVLLEPGDLMLLRAEARYQWHHQIKARKTDRWKGKDIKRERRISLTFRKVILKNLEPNL